jgi:hypothetical protein
MPEGAHIPMGHRRHGTSQPVLYGCLGRYSGIDKSRCLGVLGPLSNVPITVRCSTSIVAELMRSKPRLI